MKIAICAAETSGDLVASSLVDAIMLLRPDSEIDGLAGQKMTEAGCKKLWDIEQVNVMGISEVFKKLPSVLSLRRNIIRYYSANKPDVFIGVDAPDFNFRIEKMLKKNGVKTIHFVSPSVWAWRAHRIKKIKQSADLVLCLFPFEVDFYKSYNQPSIFVGHPLAEKLKPRKKHITNKHILLMPGSRESEVKSLLPELLVSVRLMRKQDPKIKFSMSLANDNLKVWVEDEIRGFNILLSIGDAHKKIANSDLVIVASGTATLEVALLAVPMVVVYKLSALSYQIVKRLLNTKNISLPNKILGKEVVHELIQSEVNGQNISDHAIALMASDNSNMVKELTKIHTLLSKNASVKSADAVMEFLNG